MSNQEDKSARWFAQDERAALHIESLEPAFDWHEIITQGIREDLKLDVKTDIDYEKQFKDRD